jgi:glycosyltransferase involved in cell wall biosynthesis
VDILTRRLPNHTSDHEHIQNVTEWRYAVDQHQAVSFFLSTLQNGKSLFEELNLAHPYDCINIHQPFSAFAVRRSRASEKIRKVYTCHSLSHEEYVSRNAKPRSLLERVLHFFHREGRKWIENRALSGADRIIVLSRYTRDKLLNVHGVSPDKIDVVPGGIDLERFRPATDKQKVREALGLPLNKTILLTVRGLEPRMGIENLIRAMQAVVKAVPDIHLVIGGSGPLKDELLLLSRRLNLNDHIKFTGFIPDEALPGYYQAADIFILPTIELEGFGLVTLEALASGLPVLGTPVGGTKEILGAFDDRFLFRDTSHEALAEKIVEFGLEYRQDSDKWQIDSFICRYFVEKNYSWEKNVDMMERLLSRNGAIEGSQS